MYHIFKQPPVMESYVQLLFITVSIFASADSARWQNVVSAPDVRPTYEYTFEITQRLTMSAEVNGAPTLVVLNKTDGKFYARNQSLDAACGGLTGKTVSSADVNVGDGEYREVLVINGQLPGPTIAVYQNSMLIVHVRNGYHRPISVHWHGLKQYLSPFYDGLASVTQCPIQPGELFTYRINITDSPGTYWYHSHTTAGGYGLYGALIVYDRKTVPAAKEFVAMLTDVYREDEEELLRLLQMGSLKYQAEPCYSFNRDLTGQLATAFKFHALLVNNRGWYSTMEMYESFSANLPSEKFFANSSDTLAFHLIHAGQMFPLKVALAGYQLRITTVDACTILPEVVDELILHPGERYRVELLPRKSPCQNNCEFRVTTLERFSFTMEPLVEVEKKHFTSAFLSFADRPSSDDERVFYDAWNPDDTSTDQPSDDTSTDQPSEDTSIDQPEPPKAQEHPSGGGGYRPRPPRPGRPTPPPPSTPPPPPPTRPPRPSTRPPQKTNAIVANCLSAVMPPALRRDCLHITSMNSARAMPKEIAQPSAANFVELFMNVRDEDDGIHPTVHTINGLRMVMPTYPPYFFDNSSSVLRSCKAGCGSSKICACSHVQELPLGAIVQLVLYSKGFDANGGNARTSHGHPMHLHGHSFYVLKESWPSQDSQGIAQEVEQDILCAPGSVFCNVGSWNRTIVPDSINLAGANLKNPLRLATIYVPFGGYVVIRFKADNPGWWLFHCHINVHMWDGMAMLFRVGAASDVPPIPADFPMCGLPYSKIAAK